MSVFHKAFMVYFFFGLFLFLLNIWCVCDAYPPCHTKTFESGIAGLSDGLFSIGTRGTKDKKY